MGEMRHSEQRKGLEEFDPLLCDNAIAHDYALFQFNNLATTIVGHAQLALSNPTYDSLKRSAQFSSECGQRIADIARSMLVFSRGSAGETTQCDLNELLEQVLRLAELKLDGRVCLKHQLGQVPPVLIDAASVREVFLALLTKVFERNGAAGPGSIDVLTESGDNLVRTSLRYRALAVSREAVDNACVPLFSRSCVAGAHGARAGENPAAFSVTVDFREESDSASSLIVGIPCAPEPTTTKAARVLVVDDEPVILSIFSRFISRAGHLVDTASGGREALEKIRGNEYDVVLLDWMMPEIAGADVLREGLLMKPGLPFVVVTAAYSRDVALQAVDGGAVECIGKPLNHKKVLYLIEKYSGRRMADQLDSAATEGRGEVILVAEPDTLSRDLYHLMLDHAGYEAALVGSFQETAAALEKEYYDAIMLNSSLVQDQAPTAIKSLRRLNPYTPILIIGDLPDDGERRRTLSAGAAAFLDKPLELRRFLQNVRAILDLYKEPSASKYKV